MLAMAFDVDFAQHDHVVIALHVLEGARQLLGRIGGIALEPFVIGFDDALRRIEQAFPVRIVAGPGQKRAHGGHGFFAARTIGKGSDALRLGAVQQIGTKAIWVNRIKTVHIQFYSP